jgi:hypothetical protein
VDGVLAEMVVSLLILAPLAMDDERLGTRVLFWAAVGQPDQRVGREVTAAQGRAHS